MLLVKPGAFFCLTLFCVVKLGAFFLVFMSTSSIVYSCLSACYVVGRRTLSGTFAMRINFLHVVSHVV